MMMLPNFTEYGMLPKGLHDCTIQQAKERFCCNSHRSSLWAGLESALGLMKASGLPQSCPILLDGSFTTSKDIPSDIELAFDARSINDEAALFRICKFFHMNHHSMKKNFSVDAYPCLAGFSDFSAYFQYIKEDVLQSQSIPANTRKGILRVVAW